MAASILNGKLVAETILNRIKQTVDKRLQLGWRAPSLAVIRVGADPASTIYVNHKIKACQQVGFDSQAFILEESIQTSELLHLIDTLNQDKEVDGILVQLPLPSHMDENSVLEKIDQTKDVDGFHPYNLGRLAQGNPFLRPCTPYGIIQLLNHYEIKLAGLNAVVVGISRIVGRPMAYELLNAGVTVTMCHRGTRNLKHHIQNADLIIVATGHYNVVEVDWLQDKQILIDVGIHRRNNGTIHGDVDYVKAKERIAWITPVPGGVGPMTIAALLQNTLSIANSMSQLDLD